MCGISGTLTFTSTIDEHALRRSLEAQRHRGPDASGTWSDGLCALGHRRLSIIDLSEAGRQPLSNDDGTVWVTFNGEIYNFQSLRSELESLGHRFRTRTDTEVIVHAYEQWGTDCVRRFRGMFAFGLWDRNRRCLFLARDRVGKKPLFYARLRSGFVFASEIQGVLAYPEIPREVDLEAIDAYLSWGYVPAPGTAYRGIHKLLPAHWMTIDLSDPDTPVIRSERYWSLSYRPKLKISEGEACEALREKLTEAVRLRMISDVPLGAFLSGGIDSSIVVGLMAQISGRPVKTFSIGFRESRFDETDHARRIADLWGTDHHEFIVEPDALSVLPMLVRHYGEPFGDSSAVPTYYVARATRGHVTVALNGDGADESFAGYERYFANQAADRLGRIPGSRPLSLALSHAFPDSIDPKSRVRQVSRFLAVAHESGINRYNRWVRVFQEETKANLYGREMLEVLKAGEAFRWMEAQHEAVGESNPVDSALGVDVRSYLPYDLLVKVDIASMANSLEARSPFLDHELMELAGRLPTSLKLRGAQSKYILKRAFSDLLPRENVRRRKMGFGVPVGEWFRGSLRELLCDTLLGERSRSRGYFRPEAIDAMVDQHLGERADHALRLWHLLMLELWHREFIDSLRGVEVA